MDIDELKQKWKEDPDMHPDMKYDNDRVAKALTLKNRDTNSFWLLPPAVFIIILGAVYYLWPESLEQPAAMHVGVFAAAVVHMIYYLYRCWHFVNGKSTRTPFHNLRVKTRLIEQLVGTASLLLVGLSLYHLFTAQESWGRIVEETWLVWLTYAIFIERYIYYRRQLNKMDRIAEGKKVENLLSWSGDVKEENRKLLRMWRWLFGIVLGALLLLGTGWMLGYYSWEHIANILSFFSPEGRSSALFAIFFVTFFIAWEYYRRKKLLDE